jgi:hypothetical protein
VVAAQLPAQVVAQMAKPEGTVTFRFSLPRPLGDPPAGTVVLAQGQSGPVMALFELDESYDLRFVRTHLESGSRVAVVNIESLRGTQRFQFYLVWSPDELRVHVGPQGGRGPLLKGESD